MKVLAWPAFKTRYKNPYTWLLYSQLQAQGIEVSEFSPKTLASHHFDLIHLHWPVETLTRHPNLAVVLGRVALFMSLISYAKLRGTKLVWTIHDERPHVLLHPWLASWVQTWLAAQTDAYIHLCQASLTLVEKHLKLQPHQTSHIIPHGHYRDVYENSLSKHAAREKLGLADSHFVLLSLGYISPYKNVPHLIRTVRSLNCADVTLVVAGTPDNQALRQEILDAAEEDPHIHLALKYVPDDRLQIYYNAADLVVSPFQAILNSGSVLLALSFNRPVLAPEMGAICELRDLVGDAWIKTYRDALTGDDVSSAIAAIRSETRPQIAPLDDLNWDQLGQQTLNVYRQLCSPPMSAN